MPPLLPPASHAAVCWQRFLSGSMPSNVTVSVGD
jgi:hypothetical protein